jgi:very-short-patch-repair endonuclease
VRLHCVGSLDVCDLRRHEGIALTAPPRTLLDLAEVLPQRELERAFEEAQIRRLVRPEEILRLIERSPGRRGAAVLGAVLDRDRPPGITRSEAEDQLLSLLREAGMAPTALNVRVGPHEVDMVWLSQRLVVEMDGFAYHSTRAAFERDRLRDAELQVAGYRVMRVTWRQLDEDPEALLRRIAAVLRR